MAKATIRQYFLLLVLQRCGISMIAATYATFLLARGLDLLQINLVNTVFFVTMFLCEIPTGAFADVFGRKKSFVISCGLFAISMLVYAFSTAFWEFVVAEALAAIAHTFASGAFDAWFVDKLKHHGYEEKLNPLFSKAAQVGTGVGLVAALLGAMLFDLSHSLPWLVGAGFFALAGIIALFTMKEEYFVPEPFSFKSGIKALKNTVRASVAYGVKNKNVRFIMVLVLALSFAVMAPNMQWQPFFGAWIPHQTGLGFVFAAVALSMMLGSWLAPRFLRHTSERTALLTCQAVTAVGIAGTVALGFAPALVMFLIHEVARGAFGPIKTAYLHDNIPSKERATIVSFESIAHHFGGAIGLVVSGALAKYGSIPLAWTVSGGVLLFATLALVRNEK